jgi:Immunity protein 8
VAKQWAFGHLTMTIVRPKLRRIHSPDIFDLNNPSISEDEPYCVLIQAMFGPEGIEGEESFDMLVCNPLWVDLQSKKGMFSGRHHLILRRFDVAQIRTFLNCIANNSSGESWSDVAEKLARYGKWEFEDYTA